MTPDSCQQTIVDLGAGSRALVLAGPGCGKTRLLSERIVYAARKGIPFEEMICLTFTNRASREMHSRIRGLLGDVPDSLIVGNLHRFCHRLLRVNRLIGSDVSLLDETDRDTWLADALGARRQFERKQIADLAMLQFQCDRDFPLSLRRRLDFTPTPALTRAAEAYRDYKKANRLVDFDDLLLIAYDALVSRPAGSLVYSRFKWIQVDEVQDLTPLQIAIIDMITDPDPQSTVVWLGDEQQAIFEFVGAGGLALDNLKRRCRDHIYRLDRNYRAPSYLVELCNDFGRSALGIDPALLPQSVDSRPAEAGCLQLLPASGYNLANAVAAKVRQWKRDFPSERCAVLTRTNDEAEEISAVLTARGLDHTLVSRNDLFRRVPFKTVFAHLAVKSDPDRPAEWARLLYQTRAVNTHSEARSLVDRLHSLNCTPAVLLSSGCPDQLSDRVREFIESPLVKKIADRFRRDYAPLFDRPVSSSIADELDDTYNYFVQKGFISAIDRWSDVISFFRRNFGSSLDIVTRVDELRTFNEGDLIDDDPLCVITTHKAKGLEFDNVIVYDARHRDTVKGSSDDPRVYYVAFSRAKRRLAVFHSGRLAAPVTAVSRHFEHVSPDEVEASALIERMHSPHINPSPPRNLPH